MDMEAYKDFLREAGLKDELNERILGLRDKGLLKNRIIHEFFKNSCQSIEKKLFEIMENIEYEFPKFEETSPNAPVLSFFKWMMFNHNKLEPVEDDKMVSNRLERLYQNFEEHGTADSQPYMPDEAISLYRELVLYNMCGECYIQARLPYEEYLKLEVVPIENSEVGKKLRKAFVDIRELFVTDELHKGLFRLAFFWRVIKRGYHLLRSYRKKNSICSFKDEMTATQYLSIYNVLMQVCAKKYYAGEEKQYACTM